MGVKEIIEKYRGKNSDMQNIIANLVLAVADLNAKNKILVDILKKNEIEIHITNKKYQKYLSDSLESILSKIYKD
ncbi:MULTISPECIES: hypothetical protein [Clostridium]|uniref:Uncharacterized protein n=1 Tax=Clostridium beijerinckii TaxID=1520 RepID=A0AAW3WGA9_CLOBE|nr:MULTISPECIES: hypothetical protein [Clostridium]AVK51042.1 hypothetical protein AXY43_25150 [Clostridium sp. MF28]MBC2459996.1 hypothetical protein [Clostridium beijerinckii]MBC2477498.1 hypothetical protein [Clostridium beijerinckii]NOV59580.1 hypothetical protein [Clostridium beijerinckii]NOV72734.1 hypothetical protein [Clostridium beijerinckii]